MAGVAGPMLRGSRSAGARFLIGLAAGGIAAGTLLAVPVYLLGSVLQATVPLPVRLLLLALACAVFGLADLDDLTPHVRRQVPQGLVRTLPPGTLGLVWGFDLGLLFTTQKVVSLIWVALAAVVLLDPAVGAGILAGMALIAGVAVAVWSMVGRVRTDPVTRWERRWKRQVRQASGVTMLVLSALTIVQAWQA